MFDKMVHRPFMKIPGFSRHNMVQLNHLGMTSVGKWGPEKVLHQHIFFLSRTLHVRIILSRDGMSCDVTNQHTMYMMGYIRIVFSCNVRFCARSNLCVFFYSVCG